MHFVQFCEVDNCKTMPISVLVVYLPVLVGNLVLEIVVRVYP